MAAYTTKSSAVAAAESYLHAGIWVPASLVQIRPPVQDRPKLQSEANRIYCLAIVHNFNVQISLLGSPLEERAGNCCQCPPSHRWNYHYRVKDLPKFQSEANIILCLAIANDLMFK